MTVSINSKVSGWDGVDVKTAKTSTQVLTNAGTVFTVVGDIQIISLVSECVATGTPAASTLQWQSAPTVGAAATFTGATASLASVVAGSSIHVADGQTTAPNIIVSGANNTNTYPLGIWCPTGTIKSVVGTGPTTGTYNHYLSYRSLEDSSYVIPS